MVREGNIMMIKGLLLGLFALFILAFLTPSVGHAYHWRHRHYNYFYVAPYPYPYVYYRPYHVYRPYYPYGYYRPYRYGYGY
jgi:hypothetical protein